MDLTDAQRIRMLIAIERVRTGTATPNDKLLVKLYGPIENEFVGKIVMKEFESGWFKGRVVRRDPAGLFVEYEDGDAEHLSDLEVQEILYDEPDPVVICDAIQWIEESGNKAQSFAMICRHIVNERPCVAQQIPKIYKQLLDVEIDEDFRITPYLWSLLGFTEMEKLYNGKRVLEMLVRAC